MPSKIVYVPNYEVIGSPTISDDYIASSLSGSNYFRSTESIPSTANTWELGIKFHTGTSFTGTANYFVGQIGATISTGLYEGGPATNFGNGSSWFNGAVNLDTTYAANTDYWYRVSFDGTKYSIKRSTDGENFTEIAYLENSTHIATTLVNIGYQPGSLFTSIDLKEVYMKVDGVETWRAVTAVEVDTSGSIDISKGYYNSGSAKIINGSMTKSLPDLTAGQTVGCKNNLFMTSASGVAAPYLSSTEAPAGTFDVSVKLDTPIYLDWTKQYIAGSSAANPEWSFVNSDIVTAYSVVGSPTISDNYIASSFSSRNGVAATATLDTSKHWAIFAKIHSSSDVSNRQKFIGCANSADQKVPTLEFRNGRVYACMPNSSGSGWLFEVDTGFVPSTDTDYWFKYGWDGNTYSVEVSTDGESYTSVYTNSSQTAAYHSDSYQVLFGNDLYSGSYQLPFSGTVDLKECYFVVDGAEVWRAVGQTSPSLTVSKALAYDSGSDKTYWYPQETTVTLADVKAAQTVNMKNRLYCTNKTGSSIASHTFCVGTPAGVTEYYQQPEYVWLTSDWNTILGVQEEPDEIALETTSSEGTITGVSVSEDHYWTWLLSSTYNAQGRSLEASSMSGTALSGSLLVMPSGVLAYSESNSQGSLMDAFTGYTVTFTDTTHASIASVTKTGTRCRTYYCEEQSSPTPIYRYIYVESLPATGALKTSTSGLLQREITPSETLSSYSYDSATDTISYNGHTAIYAGDCYINL